MVAYDRRARTWLIVSISASIVATFALIGQLFVVALAIAGVFLEGQDLAAVLPYLVVGLALVLLRAVLAGFGEYASRRSAHALVATLRADLTAQLLRLGPTWMSHERSGEISGVLVGGLETIEDYVTQFLPARWIAMVVPVLVLLVVFVLDPASVLVLLFTGPLLLLLLAVIGGRTRSVTQRRFLEMRTLSGFFLDVLRGIPTLKMFGRSREQGENLRRISTGYGDATMDVLRTAFQTSLVLEWGATIAIALVAVEIGLRLLDGGIAFERALAVLLITPEFFLPLRQLAIRYHVGTAGKAAIGRTFEILDTATTDDPATPTDDPREPQRADQGRPPRQPRPALDGPPHIRLRDVKFTYPGRDAPALVSLSMDMRPGRSVALVGASGSGKSTTASLLLRFIDAEAGTIEADGKPLSHYDRATWRAALAWVPQRPHLFDGSIADNIRLARPSASDAEVATAATAANAIEFIHRLPHGFETHVGEGGSRLSGGQRQRIAIARAFLRDAPLLVLDEATSHQDEASEEAIADAVARLVRGRTVLVIAHRLRMAQRADEVVLLAGGRALEAGPPDALLAQGGAYRDLVADDAEGHAPDPADRASDRPERGPGDDDRVAGAEA